MNEIYPFKLIPLAYEYYAMEPYIDQKAMKLHHDAHLKNYVYKLNKILEKYPKYQNWTLERLLCSLIFLPESRREEIKNNAGGVYNHNLYFKMLKNNNNSHNFLSGNLIKKINLQYGSFDNLYNEFKKKALGVFGSGYTNLVINKCGNIDIINTHNQDTVLDINAYPIFLIDVWEHAYYLKYNNKREEYITNFRNIINFEEAEKRYNNYIKNLSK